MKFGFLTWGAMATACFMLGLEFLVEGFLLGVMLVVGSLLVFYRLVTLITSKEESGRDKDVQKKNSNGFSSNKRHSRTVRDGSDENGNNRLRSEGE